jgi:hypothetical protein
MQSPIVVRDLVLVGLKRKFAIFEHWPAGSVKVNLRSPQIGADER